MSESKYTIFATGTISLVSLGICIVLYFVQKYNTLIFDLSLACFGSALLGLIVAIITYWTKRKEAMESFWQDGIGLLSSINHIKHFSVGEPIELIQEAIAEERSWNLEGDSSKPAKKALKSWIEEHRFFQDETFDYSELLENYYQTTINDYQSKIIEYAKQYIIFSEVNVRNLTNSYGKMDFIFANKTIRQNAYDGIYKKIIDFRNRCKDEAFHFTLLIENKGNMVVCMNKLLDLDALLYSINDNLVYASFSDDLDDKLELFRSKIYGNKPEYIEHGPVDAIVFDYQKYTRKR